MRSTTVNCRVVDSCCRKRTARAWDTVRSDDRTAYLGPSHAYCDVRAGTAKREAMRRKGLSEPDIFIFHTSLDPCPRTTFLRASLGVLRGSDG
jgi:hypothetical protein